MNSTEAKGNSTALDTSEDSQRVDAQGEKMPKELPREVKDVLDKWTGTTHNILYFWEDEGTYYVVQQLDLLYFLRLFRLGNEYVISQDHECEVGSGYIPFAKGAAR